MRADRLLIGAVLFLGAGLWGLFGYCHGNTGIAFGLPISNTKFSMDITTTGVPVLLGVPCTLIGLVLLVIAFLAAIVAPFRRSPRTVEPLPAASSRPPLEP